MAVEPSRLFGQPQPAVVIAGNGVAAATLACLLLNRGFGVVCLTRRAAPQQPSIVEAFPEATVRLFDEVGLAEALARAGAVVVRGFDNVSASTTYRMDGWWTHVERGRLAHACFLEARHRGAAALPVARLGRRVEGGTGDTRVTADGRSIVAFAAVDATGRTARWARPVRRDQPAVAAVFGGPGVDTATAGRFINTSSGWAYCLSHPEATTVGVAAPTTFGRTLDSGLASALGLADVAAFVPLGPRPASVQWAEQPIGDGWLAIGDAALAYSPLAGQGVRFALSSALAAASVLATWRDGDAALATGYYRSWVDEARQRHLAKVGRAPGAPSETSAPALDPTTPLAFTAEVRPAAVNAGGGIRKGEAAVLPHGGLVRWVGGFDLLGFRDCIARGRTVGGTRAELARLGVTDAEATALVAWALQKGLVTPGWAARAHGLRVRR